MRERSRPRRSVRHTSALMRRAHWHLAIALAGGAIVSPSESVADPATTVGGEMSFYADSDNVIVASPSLAGAVSDAESGWAATGNYLVDVVSAASVDIVSTASERWTEIRHAGGLGADYQGDGWGVTAAGSISSEPDYLSWYLGGTARVLLDDKHITPTLGYSFSRDTSGRSGTAFDVFSLILRRHTFQLGSEFIVNRYARVTVAAEGVFENGRQEKPYRYLPMSRRQRSHNLRVGCRRRQ